MRQAAERGGPGGESRALNDEGFDLCVALWVEELPPGEGPEDEYRRLCNELMRLLLAGQLFTFVTAAPVPKPNGEMMTVSGTNNEAERTLRSPRRPGTQAVPTRRRLARGVKR